jgi:hypothetical protein
MNLTLKSWRMIGVISTGVLATFVFAGGAAAITSTIFRYETAKTGYYTISASALAIRDTTVDNFVISDTMLFNAEAAGGQCWNAGINLPDRAIIKTLTVWSSAGEVSNGSASLIRHNLTTDTTDILAQPVLSIANLNRHATTANVSAALGTVSNRSYSYQFVVCLSLHQTFGDARITYTYSDAGS